MGARIARKCRTIVGVAALAGLAVSSLVVLTSSSAASLRPRSQALTPISVAYSVNGFSSANVIAVANHLGLWKKAGLQLQPQPFSGGAIPEVAALESGHVDVAFTGSGAVRLAMTGESVIIGIQDLSVTDYVIANPPVTSLSQLKGQSVIYAQGTTGQIILALALRSVGMSLKDVTGINIPDTGSLVSAFLSKDAPAVATWSPFSNTVLSQDPQGKILYSDANIYPKWIMPDVWMTSVQLARHNVRLLRKFMWVEEQANDWSAKHLSETDTLIAQMLKEPVSVVKQGAPPKNDKLLTSQVLTKDYSGKTATTWFVTLSNIFMQMGLFSPKQLVSRSQYLDFDPAIYANQEIYGK